jgi:hypothetical protein
MAAGVAAASTASLGDSFVAVSVVGQRAWNTAAGTSAA